MTEPVNVSARFSIEHIGPLVSIQDSGRQGYMRYGVTGGGPMDRTSHALANHAAGCAPQSACIEVSLGGLSLRCTDGKAILAIAGGRFDSKLNGNPLPAWCRFEMHADSTLVIRPGKWGSWCYVAFEDNLNTPSWLGSQSMIQGTHLCGSALRQDDTFSLSTEAGHRSAIKHLPKLSPKQSPKTSPGSFSELLDPTDLKPEGVIRVVPGPQDRFFSDESVQALYNQAFKLTADYNRMGIRLTGPTLSINTELNMPSAPVTRGSIQVPGHGDPLCLMADHQTTGGYPKIATIISADQDRLAQLRTGDSITFKQCDAKQAVAAAREHRDHLTSLIQTMELQQVSLDERLRTHNLISGMYSD